MSSDTKSALRSALVRLQQADEKDVSAEDALSALNFVPSSSITGAAERRLGSVDLCTNSLAHGLGAVLPRDTLATSVKFSTFAVASGDPRADGSIQKQKAEHKRNLILAGLYVGTVDKDSHGPA